MNSEELPELDLPFGADWEVYKARGEFFVLLTDVTGEPSVIVKSDPHDSRALQPDHEGIAPGYRMNNKHRITCSWSRTCHAPSGPSILRPSEGARGEPVRSAAAADRP